MLVSDILKQKGQKVECVDPNKTLKEAMVNIVKKKIGGLVVVMDGFPIGIISERDIIRAIAVQGEKVMDKPVRDFMTRKLIIGIPEDEIDSVMAFMTNNRFRHLPIMDGQRLVGIVSIGDIVKAQVHNLKVENRFLTDYITGKYPG